jgi:hypothetical protein
MKKAKSKGWFRKLEEKAASWKWTPLVAMIVIIGAFLWVGRPHFFPDRSALDEFQRFILDENDKDRAEFDARTEALEAELYELREEISRLDGEIQAGIKERESKHDAINSARTIRDVDAVLRRGRSANGKTTPGPAKPTGRLDSDPYQ